MPAARTSTTSPTPRCSPDATYTTEATYAAANIAHAAVCHAAVVHRTFETGAYHRSHAARRSATNHSPVFVTRTSLAGGALVPSTKRWRANRVLAITDSSTRRSTPGRHVDTQNAGRANSINSTNTGWIEANRAAVIAKRNIQPSVENNDMNM